MIAPASLLEELEVDATGIPFALLPGLFIGRRLWERVIPVCALERRTTFVCRSSFIGIEEVPASIEELADAYRDALVAAGVQRVVVVGGSFGGLIALELAVRHPSLVARLVVSGAPGFGAGLHVDVRGRSGLTPQKALEIAALMVSNRNALPDELIEAARHEVLHRVRLPRMIRLIRAAKRYDTARAIDAIDAPASLIWGTHDTVTPLGGWTRHVAGKHNWHVTLIDAAGHVPMLEQPDAFCRALLASGVAGG